MKRWISLLLVFAMTLSLCGGINITAYADGSIELSKESTEHVHEHVHDEEEEAQSGSIDFAPEEAAGEEQGDSSDGMIIIEDEDIGSVALAANDASEEETGTRASANVVYVLTNTLTAGEKYLIVNTDVAGSAYALGHEGTSKAVDDVTVNAGTETTENVNYIAVGDVDAASIWTVSNSYKFQNDGVYLRRSNSGETLTLGTSDSNNIWSWNETNNRLSITINNRPYYLRYNNNTFSIINQANSIYLYKETTVSSEPEVAIVASGTCGANLTWTLNSAGVLTISGTGDMYDYSDVSGSEAPWARYYYAPNRIETVSIQPGVTSIGEHAFALCSMTSVAISDSVTSIGESAFMGCYSLESVEIPTSVMGIGNDAFTDCYGLRSITVVDDNTYYCSQDGVLFNKSMTELVCFPRGKSYVSTYTIPDGVTTIGYAAFSYCGLNSVTLPDSVTTIEDFAFLNCWVLTSIEFPASITSIGSNIFYSDFTKSITFKGSAPNINDDAFTGVEAMAYYPAGDATWTESVRQNYEGNITWVPVENHTHGEIEFTSWESTISLPAVAGSYYLTDDVTLSGTWTVPSGTVSLCLNGHTITGNGTSGVINVPEKVTLSLYDCGTTGTITGGGNGQYSYGGGVDVYGTFNMYDGLISGNTCSLGGGGVVVFGTFNMHGGEISDNTEGGVFVNGFTDTTALFNMYGGSISGNRASVRGGGVYNSYGTFNMYSGLISGNIAGYGSEGIGGGVVNERGTFLMTGGEISGNTAPSAGGVYNWGTNYSHFIMTGGAITGNTASTGAGLYLEDEFNISGSPIITGNHGDNVFLKTQYDGRKIQVVGPLDSSAKIGVTALGSGAPTLGSPFLITVGLNGNGDASNFVSDDPAYEVMINSDGEAVLAIPSCIVTFLANDGTDASTTQVIAKNTATVLTANAFERTGYSFAGWNTAADGTGTNYDDKASVTLNTDLTLFAKWTPVNYSITYDLAGGAVLTANPTTYSIESEAITLNNPTKEGYTFAGWTGTDLDAATETVTIAKGSTGNRSYTATWTLNHDHDDITFTAWDSTTSLPTTAGSYYLTGNVTLNRTWTVPSGTVNLCLNGHTISGNGSSSVVSVSSGAALNMYDCGTTGTITGGSTGVSVYGAFNMYAGTISGNTSTANGGGVYIYWDEFSNSAGTFNMSGGTISGNSANKGGGVFVGGMTKRGTFTMTGGTISGNTATVTGAGLYVDGSCMMTGGEISGNTSEGTGGGVRVFGRGTNQFTMTGGTITGNTASFGAGVFLEDTLSISGSPNITGNNGNNVYLSDNAKKIQVAGTLDSDAEIGVTSASEPTLENPFVITSGLNGKGTEANFISDNTAYEVKTNSAGEAILAIPSCTVTFLANDDTDTGTTQVIAKNTATVLTANAFERTGYSFAGWNTAANGSGTAYADGASVTLNSDLTLYAQWTPVEYSVTYVVNGGVLSDDAVKSYTVESEAITLPVPTRTGYTFDGWYKAEDFTGAKVETIAAGSTGNVELYAKWDLNTFVINDTPARVTYNGTEQKPTIIPTDGELVLTEGTDYTVTYSNNINVGEATITVTGIGNYAAAQPIVRTFIIDPKDIAGAEITLGEALTYTGEELTQAVTSVVVDGLTATVEVSNNKGTDAGDYTLTVTGTGNFTGTATKAFTISKGSQAAPTGVAATAETISGKNDGTITGLTTAMEYSADGGETWTKATGTSLTDLAPGTYQVRYAGTANCNASEPVTVTVAASTQKLTVTWKNDDGTVLETDNDLTYNATPSYDGAVPTKTADADSHYTFAGWSPAVTSVTENTTYTATYTSEAHSWNDGVVTTEPTCTAKGVETFTCTVCERTRTEEVAALGHDLVHHDAKAPTCTEIGWDAYDTCSRCDYTTYAEKAALGHDLVHHDAKVPTCTEIGWDAYDTCSRCDYTTYAEKAALGHDYIAAVTAPTCTEQGYTTHTCSRCGDSYKDTYVNALGHSWGEWTVTTPATCTAAGVETRVCTNDASHKETRTIAATGHSWGELAWTWTGSDAAGYTAAEATFTCLNDGSHAVKVKDSELEIVVVDPTPTEAGSWTYTASVTGPDNKTYTDRKVVTIPPAGYTFKDPVYTWANDNSKCTALQECNEDPAQNITETVNAAYAVTTPATCTATGIGLYTATFTNTAFRTQTKDEVIPATGHAYGAASYEWAADNRSVTATRICANDARHKETETVNTTSAVTTPATCEAKGETTYAAVFTNAAFTRQQKTVADIPALGHSWGAWTVTTPATCTAAGVETRVCLNDASHKETRAIAATGHMPASAVEENRVEATCTKAGSYDSVVYCSVCGEELSRETVAIPAAGHKEVEIPAVAATCTETGLTAGVKCSVCGEILMAQETVPALGHDFGAWTQTKAPTCTEKGEEQRICSRCEAKETREVPATGHAWGEPTYVWTNDNTSVTATRVCANDAAHKEIETAAATYEVTRPATETEAGVGTWTSAAFKNEVFAVQTKEVPIPPTGYEVSYEWSADNSKVTATAVPYDTAAVTVIETVGTTSEVTKPATCEAKGETTYTAAFESGLFSTQTKVLENVPATGHTPAEAVEENRVEATCTAAGSYDSVVYCSVCGKELSREAKTIPALGHTEVEIPAVAATCTDSGLTAGVKCSVCGEILTAQETVPALGHAWGEPIWTWADDHSNANAAFVCGNDASHKESVEVTNIELVVVDPTPTEAGSETYTATVVGPDGKTYTDEKVIPIPPTGYTYEVIPAKLELLPNETGSVVVQDNTGAVIPVAWTSNDESVATVDAEGNVTAKKAGYTTLTATVNGQELMCEVQGLFVDVTDRVGQFYFDYVYDLANRGIVKGWEEDNTFRPMNNCNRAAMVTFLWRLAGKPEPETTATFKDMTDNPDFNKAISWASENGIAGGYSDGTFGPWKPCNRAAFVTFLWRYAGRPEPTTTATFSDMTGNTEFDKAISWASENGIATGWDDNTFRPWNDCRRLAVVSFLCRYEHPDT